MSGNLFFSFRTIKQASPLWVEGSRRWAVGGGWRALLISNIGFKIVLDQEWIAEFGGFQEIAQKTAQKIL